MPWGNDESISSISSDVLLALAPAILSGCSETPEADTRDSAVATVEEVPAGDLQPISLRVPDMSCALCAQPIEHHLEEMGVQEVTADLETKWVTGRFNPERITTEAIKTKIEGLGFRVTEVRTG